jgi:hypothetical protein
MSKNGLDNTGITRELKFIVGQLAMAIIDIPEDDEERHGFIGRIKSIDDLGNVVLAAYDDDEINVTLGNLKQAVHYDNSKPHSIVKGERANVYVVDHPDPFIFPGDFVTTSTVLEFNPYIKFFETRNTLYMAKEIDHGDGHIEKSPYLA